jgi:trehalose 6-phosphate phosphatase
MAQEPTIPPADALSFDPLAQGLAEGRRLALFLDLDGTLVEIADTPETVRIDVRLRQWLAALRCALDGALALVSGRAITDIDRLIGMPDLAIAGLHGLERRDVAGCVHRAAVVGLEDARERLVAFAGRWPGVRVEDKGATIALHYRQAPDAEAKARALVQEIVTDRTDLMALQGKMVVEIKPHHSDKGAAIAAFMAEPPFQGRVPVFAGDDVTDEDGFAVVNSLGGHSIRIGGGTPSQAQRRLPDVKAMHAWLERAAVMLAASADAAS